MTLTACFHRTGQAKALSRSLRQFGDEEGKQFSPTALVRPRRVEGRQQEKQQSKTVSFTITFVIAKNVPKQPELPLCL